MEALKFNESGTDAVFLGHVNIFFPTLFDLEVFKHDWREDKLGSQSTLQGEVGRYGQGYQGGLTGNRLDIAARNEARKFLTARIRMILQYVAIFANENDIAALLKTGVVTTQKQTRTRKSVKAVVPAS
jgi:hypothetical protein